MLTAKQQQIKRLYSRIITMLQKGNVIFLTFTFNDKTMLKTNQKTRLRYVKHYLNKYACNYVLNIDYGKITQREHYHAIAKPKYKEFVFDKWTKYGFLKGEIIGHIKRYKNINKSLDDIAERLTNHATKDTTRHNKIIYSRISQKADNDTKSEIDMHISLRKFKSLSKHIDFDKLEDIMMKPSSYDEMMINNGYEWDDTLEEYVKVVYID